jgi:hypothetical protein
MEQLYTGQAGATHQSDLSQPESPKTPNMPTELQTDPKSKQQQHETKGQSSSDPTSYATSTTHSKSQPRNNAQHQKTKKNQLETPNPWERPYRQGPLESPKSENHQVETTPSSPHPTAGTQKANCTQAIEQEKHA